MIVFGCYPITASGQLPLEPERVAAVCREHKLGRHRMRPGADGQVYVDVLVEAVAVTRRGGQAAIVGFLDDIMPPASVPRGDKDAAFTDVEWRESWLAYAEARGITFYPVPTVDGKTGLASMSRESVIRSYQRATVALEKAVQNRLTAERRNGGGYVSGRPPYGYRVKAGRFEQNPRQVAAIKVVFAETSQGRDVGTIIKAMKRKFPSQYWDRVKVRRILAHAALYCLGTYVPGRGESIALPELAFLPADWARLAPSPGEAKTPAQLAAVSSPGRLGTLRAQSLKNPRS